jgi:hypothetical protein
MLPRIPYTRLLKLPSTTVPYASKEHREALVLQCTQLVDVVFPVAFFLFSEVFVR